MGPDTLVGRDGELDELDRRLRAGRLVTVVGPGGVGKTALARAGAGRAAPMFAMGVKYVDLTRVDEESGVPGALAGQLGFDSFDALLSSPGDRPALLVVDNCEHLLDAVARSLVQILGSCEQPTILATSRSPLDLPGESVMSLAPLTVPRDDADAASCASVQLFVERGRQAGAHVDEADLGAVVELCRRVDGLPLAIEIAAARARTMSVAEIVRRLATTVAVLDRPRFRGDRRHRSVADTIRWSYDLLSPDAAALLDELAVFVGPFASATARAVASVDTAEGFDRLLDELTDASLVSVDTTGLETRYRLLETVRQFALERLRHGGELDAVYDRYVDHVIAATREIVRGATTSWRPDLLHDLVAAFDDLAEAVRWCTAHDEEPRRAYALCATLWGIVHQGRADDIAELARRTLARWPDPTSTVGVQCVATLATAEYVTGHPERAIELSTSALASIPSPGLPSVTLRRVRGQALRAIGDTAGSLSTFREGAQIAHELGMPAMAMELEITAAVVAADAGEVEAGVVALRELVERAAAAGSVITESWACAGLGWVLLRVDPVAALPIVEQGLVEARRIDYPIAVAVDLRSLAYARLLLGDLPGAIVAARELVEDLLDRGALSNIRLAVDVAAVLAHGSGHPAWATLAATARALPISTLAAAHYELVPLPDVDAPVLGRREVISTVRAALEDLAATVGVGDTPSPPAARPAAGDVDGPAAPSAWIERRGDVCEIGFASRVVTLRRSKGLDDLIRLIEADGREIHCLDVAGAAVEESSTGPVLDDAARRDYEQRIRDLQHDIDEAEQHHDLARAYASQVEMDTLVDHLTAALGLGAKTRSVGGTTERARSAVTHRIRSAVRRVEKLNPNLGRHLRHAINTGTYCSYRPEQPTTWRIT